jgi:hypothetical protein
VRGQSETIGFVLVFALVVTTIATLYVVGIPALEDARDSERIDNMERAFEVLDANFDDIVRQSAPSRGTEIKLSGGQLSMGNQTTITLNATDAGNRSNSSALTATVRPIVYTDSGTEIVYSSGTVLRADQGGSVVRSDPDWVIGDARSVLPVVITEPGGEKTGVGGSSTVLVDTRRNSRGIQRLNPGQEGNATRVNVPVSSGYADAWAQYFASEAMVEVDGPADSDGDGVRDTTYQFETDQLYIPTTTIDIEFRF